MPLAQTDSYKLSHKGFMNKGTTKLYSNMTARSGKHFPVLQDRWDGKVVVFGFQKFVIEFLINEWNSKFFQMPKHKAIKKFKRLVDAYLGKDAVDMAHFEALHDIGYLPLHIKSIDEGNRVNIKVPLWTITNTHPDFAWLVNYLETVMSCECWKPITTATIISEYRKLINEYALKTTGSLMGTQFQIHGFEFRGMANRQDAASCAAGMCLSTNGTDTIPALELIEEYYFTDIEKYFVATSVPASEHSIACLGTAVQGELESYRKWITVDYPTGIVSVVSDTYDYWKVLEEYLPILKEEILARPVNDIGLSKVVIRPDSGNPADIICGLSCFDPEDDSNEVAVLSGALSGGFKAYKYQGKYFESMTGDELSEAEVKGSVELLWETFGGTVTEQGYKVLDSHIGLIYGDSITLKVALDVMERLAAKGFASTNIVFGVGSYTMQYLTRDSLGMAVKATYGEVDGVGYELFKDPITDSGMKKSAKGLLRVEKEGDDYVLYDQQTLEQEATGELTSLFLNGKLMKQTTFEECRNRLWK